MDSISRRQRSNYRVKRHNVGLLGDDYPNHRHHTKVLKLMMKQKKLQLKIMFYLLHIPVFIST